MFVRLPPTRACLRHGVPGLPCWSSPRRSNAGRIRNSVAAAVPPPIRAFHAETLAGNALVAGGKKSLAQPPSINHIHIQHTPTHRIIDLEHYALSNIDSELRGPAYGGKEVLHACHVSF